MTGNNREICPACGKLLHGELLDIRLENARREHRRWLDELLNKNMTLRDQCHPIRQLILDEGQYMLLDPLDAMYNILDEYEKALTPLQGESQK